MKGLNLSRSSVLSLRKAAVILGGFVLTLSLGAAAAVAKERKTQPRQAEFYAYSAPAAPDARPAAHAGGCFVTLTAAEAARGMRHWRPGC